MAELKEGSKAPAFSLTDDSGKTVKLSDYKGKIVVIESYNSDCPFCHNHYASGAMQVMVFAVDAQGLPASVLQTVEGLIFRGLQQRRHGDAVLP